MTSADLKPEQIDALARSLGRSLRYVNRLCARMQRLRFPADDPLVQSATAARIALQKLYTDAYTASQQARQSSR